MTMMREGRDGEGQFNIIGRENLQVLGGAACFPIPSSSSLSLVVGNTGDTYVLSTTQESIYLPT